MPHLQLDTTRNYTVATKRALARRFGDLYAQIMQSTPDLVTVTVRELGDGGIWQCTDGDPVEAAVLTCDIRRGRPPEQRAHLAEELIDACVDMLGIEATAVTVEFTQHAGDEIYHKVLVDGVLYGGLGRDWSEAETREPLMETLVNERRSADPM